MLELGEEGAQASTSRRSACSTPRRRTSSPCAQALVDEHGGEVPPDRDALETLPGVGRKTANVVMNCAFGARDLRGRHPCLPRRATAPASRPARRRWRSRRSSRRSPPAALPARRPPLADPARPLRLQGAQARMLALRGRRPLPLPAEDAARRLAPNPLEPRPKPGKQFILRHALISAAVARL